MKVTYSTGITPSDQSEGEESGTGRKVPGLGLETNWYYGRNRAGPLRSFSGRTSTGSRVYLRSPPQSRTVRGLQDPSTGETSGGRLLEVSCRWCE